MNTTIRWAQIIPLLGLDLAILISWIAYHEYQPVLLQQFKFTELTLFLLVVQGIILFVTPPIAGLIADRMRSKGGTRFPIVNIGVSFVSMVFMVVAVTIFTEPGGIIRMLFPVMIVLWLISMNIFHSPAISSVEMFVPPAKLTSVMAIFAVLADLTAAIEPVLLDIASYFGAPITFAAGGLLVFGTGWWFTKAAKKLVPATGEHENAEAYKIDKSNFPLVLGLGILMGIAVALFFDQFPGWADKRVPFVLDGSLTGNTLTALLIGFAALISYPLGKLLENKPLGRAVISGFLVVALLAMGFYLNEGWISFFCMALFPIGFALVSVTALPIAFMKLTAQHKVFGIGLFFGGLELAGSVIKVVQNL
ncbi:MAG: hypothetical protein H6581_19565 [Bacteroidia bacterium]|nr:hypothetical protein [Bacteroidia bacterium]